MQQDEELSNIKKPNETELISKEEAEFRIREIARCKRDIIYFAENYFRIVSTDRGLELIKPYPKQKELLNFFVNENRSIVLASRQTGKCVCGETIVEVSDYLNGPRRRISIEEYFNEVKSRNRKLSVTPPTPAGEKFVDSLRDGNGVVLTDFGREKIVKVHKTVVYDVWLLKTANFKLRCADNHVVFNHEGREVFVKDLKHGDFIRTVNGLEIVKSVENTGERENMYDLELGEDSLHRYFTNGILSHNTTTYTVFVLWYTMFNHDKKVMILANKADTALDIMKRIHTAYEYIPAFLKPGAAVLNKGEIVFGNRSVIKSFACSSSAARGFSANCVDKNTKIKIRLFKFIKLTVPIKWMKFICRNWKTHV